jgi:hypothetical protein
MAPAMKRVEQSLGSAMDVLSDTIAFSSQRHRQASQRHGQTEEDEYDEEREPPTSGPGDSRAAC